ncbi:DUF2511 domain-containing protein [Candidatus Palauibacter sp.]|uniref:DUF2511 domain-containing protein n=1 Tax=Candidatus Palauibacter sp. TaxID=3101350 RepID=UPI003B52787C
MRKVVMWSWIVVLSGCEQTDDASRVEGSTSQRNPTPLERMISRSDLGEEWPFTVDSGTVACPGPGSAVTFTTPNGQTYAVNGRAIGLNRWPRAREITRHMSFGLRYEAVDRLTVAKRRSVFKTLVDCQDAGRDDDYCDSSTSQAHNVTSQELQEISNEGVENSWPPLGPPLVMPVNNIIEIGLRFCR